MCELTQVPLPSLHAWAPPSPSPRAGAWWAHREGPCGKRASEAPHTPQPRSTRLNTVSVKGEHLGRGLFLDLGPGAPVRALDSIHLSQTETFANLKRVGPGRFVFHVIKGHFSFMEHSHMSRLASLLPSSIRTPALWWAR